MTRKSWLVLFLVALCAAATPTLNAASVCATAQAKKTQAQASTANIYGKLPLSFEENHGQADNKVRFLSRAANGTIFLTATDMVVADKTSAARLSLVGTDPRTKAAGLEELSGKVNYLLGKDPAKWQTDIPTFGKVRYAGIYPGVDLVYYGTNRDLEYDFVVKPGANPASIRFKAANARIDGSGDLVIQDKDGATLREHAPATYQMVDGQRREVASRFIVLANDTFGFAIGAYDRTEELVIDPSVVYSTYFGGSNSSENAEDVAADDCGNAYVTGYTDSTNFPTAGGTYQGSNGGGVDVFVAKFSATGSLTYSTYIGGSGDDYGISIAVDSSGNAYVTGNTSSTNFPTAGSPYQGSKGTGQDAFVLKLNSTGTSLTYSTYFGGNGYDDASGIRVDGSGNAYVTGTTASTNLSTTGSAYQGSYGGGAYDVYVLKLNSSGSSATYLTYLGGSGEDDGGDVAIDGSGNAYVVGSTQSTSFASGIYGSKSGTSDAFVAKLNSSGTSLTWSTYLGGSSTESAESVAVDITGAVYVTGSTSSTNFPVSASPYQSTKGSGMDAFVAKLSADGTTVLYATYFGGNGDDDARRLAIDDSGGVYISGYTMSSNLATTANATQGSYGGSTDIYVLKLTADFSKALFLTYLGGSSTDGAGGLAVDKSNNIYLSGYTFSSDFPTTNPYQGSRSGSMDAIVTKISPGSCN